MALALVVFGAIECPPSGKCRNMLRKSYRIFVRISLYTVRYVASRVAKKCFLLNANSKKLNNFRLLKARMINFINGDGGDVVRTEATNLILQVYEHRKIE